MSRIAADIAADNDDRNKTQSFESDINSYH